MTAILCPQEDDPDAKDGISIIGCGSTNVQGPDEEGLYDCLDCGIWFKPAVVPLGEE